jgi:hypothetical protein
MVVGRRMGMLESGGAFGGEQLVYCGTKGLGQPLCYADTWYLLPGLDVGDVSAGHTRDAMKIDDRHPSQTTGLTELIAHDATSPFAVSMSVIANTIVSHVRYAVKGEYPVCDIYLRGD